MQRLGNILAYQLLMLLLVESYAWPREMHEDYDTKGLFPAELQSNRFPNYELYPGKRSGSAKDEVVSYEDFTSPSLVDTLNGIDKRVSPNMYSFGLGKRNRAYGFGLGKRFEHNMWKTYPASSPSFRQERSSKIYSFGLGKRGVNYDDQGRSSVAGQRQFSFGLGKRETQQSTSAAN